MMNCGNRCTGFTIKPKNESLSCALICFTLKKSASADFLFDSIFASSIATEKLFIKSEYTSNTTAFENAFRKTSPGINNNDIHSRSHFFSLITNSKLLRQIRIFPSCYLYIFVFMFQITCQVDLRIKNLK